jgi:exodeoxyribonuclease V beta subunit
MPISSSSTEQLPEGRLKAFELFDAPLEGINLVESSAGTGKTYNISGLVVRILAETDPGLYGDDFDPSKILVVTFTRAATQELRERISQRVQQAVGVLKGAYDAEGDAFLEELKSRYKNRPECLDRLKHAQQNMDQASIYTIHGFCQNALQEYALESNSSFDVQYTGNDRELRIEAADTLWREELLRLEEKGKEARGLRDLLLNQMKTPDALKTAFDAITGKPYIKFNPDWDEADFEAHYTSVMTAVEKMESAFDRDELSSLMNQHQKALHGNKFKKQQWTNMLDNFEDALSSGFSFEEQYFWKLRAGVKKTTGKYDDLHHPFFEAVEDYIQSKPELLTEGYYVILARRFLQRFQALKEERRLRSFDDILISMQQAVGALEQAYGRPVEQEQSEDAQKDFCEKLRLQYPFALVDEFQDTDPVQLGIFEQLYFNAPQTCLYMIGDPKQSIYKFRGADIDSYQSVANYEGVRKFTLGKNFRSVREMVDAVNMVFSPDGEQTEWPGGIRFMPSGAHKTESELFVDDDRPQPFQFMLPSPAADTDKKVDAQDQIDQSVVDEIQRLLKLSAEGKARIKNDTPLRPNDIAILVGRHRQAAAYRERLLERGIKSIHKTNKSVFESDEAGFLSDLMRLLGNITNAGLLRMFLFSDQMGHKTSDLQQLDEDSEAYSSLLETLAGLRERYEKNGFSALLRTFLYTRLARLENKSVPVIERILSHRDGEQAYTNLIHLNDLIDQREREHSPSLEELLKWLETEIEDASKGKEEAEIRINSDEALVHLVTLHGCKGLEYPIIFCPSLWQQGANESRGRSKGPSVFKNDEKQTEVRFTDYQKADVTARKERESLAENLRLMYVALTRARYRCYLPVGNAVTTESITSPLMFTFLGEAKIWEIRNKKSEVKQSAYSELLSQISELAESQPGLCTVMDLNNERIAGQALVDDRKQLVQHLMRQRERSYYNQPDWFITSYSSIKKGASQEAEDEELEPESDKMGVETTSLVEKRPQRPGFSSIFDFEKGARAGTFMHRLFEDLDFRRLEEDAPAMVARYLEEDGFAAEWKDVLMGMLRACLTTALPGSGARLAEKGPAQTRDEMQFHFSLRHADANELIELMQGSTTLQTARITEGFMTGFIDLLFEHEGKFYILDYKSDHLGDKTEDYAPDVLGDVMQERGYSFQYHIYLVALMRFLKYKLGDGFDYQTHIGGAYYLFLRGINGENAADSAMTGEDITPTNGIFFDNPEQEIIERMDAYFAGEKVE